MSKDSSFDVVSKIDLQFLDDAVNTATKDILNRFDLKSTGSTITFDRTKKTITLFAPSDFQLEQIREILFSKMSKRGISPLVLSNPKKENATGGSVREENSIVCGVEKEFAKKIVKDIKDSKIKVQASIMDDLIRVSGKSKDDLQAVIAFIRSKNYSIPLQFDNYR